MLRFANPAFVLRLCRYVAPWLGALAVLAGAIGLYMAFYRTPDDYQQGVAFRIMYLHVPAAWVAVFAYVVMCSAALGTLVWRHPVADAAQKAAAPVGAAFTFVCLLSGSLWGKPIWNTFWVWDARLTSVLVLFLIYLSLIAVWRAIEDPARAARVAAIMTLAGAVNLPIIKFSVEWWNTLHQPASLLRSGGSAIHSSMLWPLLIMAAAATLLFFTLHLMSIRNEILHRRLGRLMRQAAYDLEDAAQDAAPPLPREASQKDPLERAPGQTSTAGAAP